MDLSSDTYEADYRCECEQCLAVVYAGDRIGYYGGQIVCDGCWTDAVEGQAGARGYRV